MCMCCFCLLLCRFVVLLSFLLLCLLWSDSHVCPGKTWQVFPAKSEECASAQDLCFVSATISIVQISHGEGAKQNPPSG